MKAILTGFRDFFNSEAVHDVNDLEDIVNTFKDVITTSKKVEYSEDGERLRVEYLNCPIAFDIETTSFYDSNGEKTGIMYEWTFGIYGHIIIGRTWDDFRYLLDELSILLELSPSRRLVIGVHNLAFEFQFMRKHLNVDKVFALDDRKPCYVTTKDGFEFRCTYILSGYSLAKVAEHLTTYSIKKLVGDLDYDKIRHSSTVLTPEEIAYCVNDVKIVMAYLAECLEAEREISRIPLTKTGYSRRLCKENCFAKSKYKRYDYRRYIRSLEISVAEYHQLKNAFQGGYTHANAFVVDKVYRDVTSFDFTSSYPAVMIAEKFPSGPAQFIARPDPDFFRESIKYYCCIFDVMFVGLETINWVDSYISRSRCTEAQNCTTNNGRVVSADILITTITEQDYMIIQKVYKWSEMRVINLRRYTKGYLPTPFVATILKLYSDKTVLKGVEGKEAEYMNAKELLNSCYGMIATGIARRDIIYDSDDWRDPPPIDYEYKISKYNNSWSRFLYYPWSIYVTAYARRNLWTGILECGVDDYLYSDTDSIKILHAEKHLKYINEYNDRITKQLLKACEFHGFDPELIAPKTIKGEKKPLGIWSFDGHYSRFKALGAKRYMVEYSDDPRNGKDAGKLSITVSGLNKKTTVPYLSKLSSDDPFKAFRRDLYVPPEYTGKMTHTYIDNPRDGLLTDYTGITEEYHELSCIHLEKADYTLSRSQEYIDFLLTIGDD